MNSKIFLLLRIGFVMAALHPLGSFAAQPKLWEDVSESSIASSDERRPTAAKTYRTVRLNQDLLAELLAKAPMEFTAAAKQRDVILSLPKPRGGFARFRIEESPMVSPQVAAQAPGWKTYSGRGIDDPTAVLRFSWSALGLSAMVLGEDGAWFIDPYSQGDRGHYRVFHRRDASEDHCSLHCSFG